MKEKLLEKIKNDKLKAATVVTAILVFIVGIIITGVNAGNTYAFSYTYICPLGNYSSESSSSSSESSYVEELGYYCTLYKAATETDSVTAGKDLTSENDTCSLYLTELGYDYINNNNYVGCKYSAIQREYIVSYDANEGTGAPANQIKIYNEDLVLNSEKPTREGHKFLGWGISATDGMADYQPGDTYTSNSSITLYALWSELKPATYIVKYDANGGTNAPSYQTKIYNVELKLSEQVPTREGHKFLGWGISATDGMADYQPGDTYASNSGITLYALWSELKPATYIVKYDANGGTNAPSYQTKKVNEDLVLSEQVPTREGHKFLGWGTSATDTSADYQPGGTYTSNSGITLYAVWEELSGGDSGSGSGSGQTPNPATYTVKYDANGGTGAPVNQTKTEDVGLKLSDTVPTRKGYKFLGWGTSATDTSADYQPGGTYISNSGITLYAVWKISDYKIEYVLNGGAVTGNPTTGTYNQDLTIKHPTKSVIVTGNVNDTGAVVGNAVTVEVEFKGWTSSNIDKNNAYYGDTAWKDYNTFVTATSFKNLTLVDGATVTLVANWGDTEATLPTVTKEGYTCTWNTMKDGKGQSYASSGKYTVKGEDDSVNLYAVCVSDKTDEDLGTSPSTGSALIYVAWIVGAGALGYSVYYFVKRKGNI